MYHCQLITRPNPWSVVWPLRTVPRLCLCVWYHSCLLGCTGDHSYNRFPSRGPFQFSSPELNWQLSSNTQGIISLLLFNLNTFVLLIFFVQYCLFVRWLRGPEVQWHRAVAPNQTTKVHLKQLKRHALYHKFILFQIYRMPMKHECVKLILGCFR